MPRKTTDIYRNDQEKTTNSTMYTIALDKFDLNILTIETFLEKRNNDIKPLWDNRNNSVYNNYCEFQIVTKNNTDDDVNSDTETDFNNNKDYPCYICNILVPSNYEMEHLNSTKHQTNLKITNNAVQRVKNHLNQEITVRGKTKTNPSHYFCESCVTIVNKSDKIKHENTKVHKISITQDRLLNDLLNVYLESAEINAQIEESNVKIIDNIDKNDLLKNTNDTKENIDAQTNGHSSSKNNESEIKCDDSMTKTDPNSAIKEISIKSESNTVVNSTNIKTEFNESMNKAKYEQNTDLQKYLDKAHEILQNPFVKNFKALDNDHLEIRIGSDVVKVKSDNFHSYCREIHDPYNIICSICSDVFHEIYVREHDINITHLENLFLPLNDKNCIRQLNTIWSHCIICNLTIGTSSINDHKKEKIHKDHLKESVIANKAQILDPATPTTSYEKWHCKVCDILIGSTQMDSHLQGSRHKTKLKQKSLIAAEVESTKVSNKTEQQIHFHLSKTEFPHALSCKVCNVKIPNSKKNVDEHVNGNNHLANFFLLITRNKLKQTDGGYICEVCNILVSRTSEVGHIGTDRHKNNLKTNENSNPQNNVPINAADGVTNQRTTQKEHEFCNVCKVDVGIGNMREHVAGRQHNKNLKENASNHYCYICNVYVPRDENSMKLHENGYIHTNKINEIMKHLELYQNSIK